MKTKTKSNNDSSLLSYEAYIQQDCNVFTTKYRMEDLNGYSGWATEGLAYSRKQAFEFVYSVMDACIYQNMPDNFIDLEFLYYKNDKIKFNHSYIPISGHPEISFVEFMTEIEYEGRDIYKDLHAIVNDADGQSLNDLILWKTIDEFLCMATENWVKALVIVYTHSGQFTLDLSTDRPLVMKSSTPYQV